MTPPDGPRSEGRRDKARSYRDRMVEQQIRARGIRDEAVLRAMREVPRHLFVPEREPREAYGDHALPIGHGQTISQPYIVAYMTALLEPDPGLRALEIGTGSGYQAAVLAAAGFEVWSVERIPALHERARRCLEEAGYVDHVRLRLGDGSRGWPEGAPFQRALLTAAAESVPDPVVEQVEPDGLIVAPLGDPWLQTITRLRKRTSGRLEREALEGARFVPLVRDEGEAGPAGGRGGEGPADEGG